MQQSKCDTVVDVMADNLPTSKCDRLTGLPDITCLSVTFCSSPWTSDQPTEMIKNLLYNIVLG